MKSIDLVRDFHRLFGQRIAEEPDLSDKELNRLRISLIAEELCELAEALGFKLNVTEEHDDLPTDPVAALDAYVDLRYVTDGGMLSHGLAKYFDAALAEVHASNLRKLLGGRVYYNSAGKVVKPPGWVAPDLARVMREVDGDLSGALMGPLPAGEAWQSVGADDFDDAKTGIHQRFDRSEGEGAA